MEVASRILLVKGDILELELNRLFGVVAFVFDCVFSDAEEVVKGDHGQVRCGLLAWLWPMLVRRVNEELHHIGLDGELLPCRRVDLAVSV